MSQYIYMLNNSLWLPTHEPIAIDKFGILQDGQHRLRAVAHTGISIKAWVCYNCDPAAFIAVDQGAKRTIGDILQIEGTEKGAMVAAIVRYYRVFQFQKWHQTVSPVTIKAMPSEIHSLANEKPEIFREATNKAAKWAKKFKPLSKNLIGGMYAFLTDNGLEEKANKFFSMVSSGIGITEGDAIDLLRTQLIRDASMRKGARKYNSRQKAILLVKAWNFYGSGKKPSRKSIYPNVGENPKIWLG